MTRIPPATQARIGRAIRKIEHSIRDVSGHGGESGPRPDYGLPASATAFGWVLKNGNEVTVYAGKIIVIARKAITVATTTVTLSGNPNDFVYIRVPMTSSTGAIEHNDAEPDPTDGTNLYVMLVTFERIQSGIYRVEPDQGRKWRGGNIYLGALS